MELQKIKSLIDLLAASELSELEFSQDGWSLRLAKRSAVVAASGLAPTPHASQAASDLPAAVVVADPGGAPQRQPDTTAELAAPLYGVVHLRPSPNEPSFTAPGQPVFAGQTLCVIEAMKVFNEVRAEHDATVAAVLVASGQEVEAGQPLFRFA